MIENIKQLLKEREVLPGGTVILSEWLFLDPNVVKVERKALMGQKFDRVELTYKSGEVVTFSVADLVIMLKSLGLIVKESTV